MTPHGRLIAPCEEWKDSFIAAVREFRDHDRPWDAAAMGLGANVAIDDLESAFTSLLAALEDAAGRNVMPGGVPRTTYWLVDDLGFIGRVSIRHRLNETLMRVGGHVGYEIRPSRRGRGYGTLALRLGLEKARALGIRKALLTCDATNLPSRKIIEANGGVLEDEIPMGEGKPVKQRFWIDLA